jgi:single-strand DNA-binding protein
MQSIIGIKINMAYVAKNKIQIIGQVNGKPEIRILENGMKLAHLTISTEESYINDIGKKVTETVTHSIMAFDKFADICEKYITSNNKQIAVEGKLINRAYTDKEGAKHYVTDIHMSDMLLLGHKY